jgi:hypothetical protein
MDAVFDVVMSAKGMPNYENPEYERWLFDASISAFRTWLAYEGLVVVPKLPSEDQFRAGSTFRFTVETHGYKDTAGIYEAMISAAPDALRAEGE